MIGYRRTQLMPEQQPLAAEWDKFSREIYKNRSMHYSPGSDAHRAFYRGALSVLSCMKRGTKFEDLVNEIEAGFRTPDRPPL
jgi:hypothetical protein